MKQALVMLEQWCAFEGLDVTFVGNIHDEIQAEVAALDAERYAQLAEAAMVAAGEYFSLLCPLKGTATIGSSWAETH